MTFTRSFVIGGTGDVLAAGTYDVETDEELLEGLSFPAYRRIATFLYSRAAPPGAAHFRVLTIDPAELDAALERDRTPGAAPSDTSPGCR